MKFSSSINLIIVVILAAVSNNLLMAQKNSWSAQELFEKRVFIENLGQYDLHKQSSSSTILFGSFTKGIHVYFTNNGFILNHFLKDDGTRKQMTRKKNFLNRFNKKEKEKEERDMIKVVPNYRELIWEGSNPNPEVVTGKMVSHTYNFTNATRNGTLKAKAYNKIRYINIYPNIDVEFYFPEDSVGFKYNYIVHAGGNAALIQEHWKGDSRLIKQTNGDIKIQTDFGDVYTKAPWSYTKNEKKSIETEYKLSHNTVSYEIKGSFHDAVIIDPWVAVPVFGSGTTAMDIDFDVAGNTFVYGGSSGGFEVLKYDNAGTLLWSYAPFGTAGYYGDFAVDQNTGSVYVINGLGDPNVVKVSSSGTFLADHFGSAAMNEMWRISFSSCTNQAVIAGGGTGGTDVMSYLDTNLSAMSTVNVLGVSGGCCYDMAMLTVDNYGSCYFLHVDNTVFFSGHENHIVKVPMPTFLPITYSVPSGYYFRELGSVMYGGSLMGFNGLSVSNKTLYSYDAYRIVKRNATTGVLISSKQQNLPIAGDSTRKYWGGIATDECQNVFVGSRDTVYQYDSLLNLINIYPMPDTVIDIRISKFGLLYVCGDDFVKVLIPSGMIACGSPIDPNITVVDATCYTQGSASVAPSGGSAPYNIVWNTVPEQTGPSVTNLAPGTYTVSISDASCTGNFGTATFTITAGPGAFSTNLTIENISCNGLSDGSISLNPVGGIFPYTYTWDTLGLSGSSVSGLGVGVYGITITDSNGCINTFNIPINQPLAITAHTNADTLDCFGDIGNIVCFPSGGTGPYTVLWNTTTPVLNDTLLAVAAGIYSITVTDTFGCVFNFADTLFEAPQLNLSLTTQNLSCDGAVLGSITANVSGGTSPYAYSWSNDISNSTNVDSNLVAGIYTVTVTDDNGCEVSLSDTLTLLTFPTIGFTSMNPCNGGTNGSITASALGGTSGTTFTYAWNTIPVQSGLTATGVGAGLYVLTTQGGGCTNHDTIVLSEEPIVDTLKITGIVCGVNEFVTLFAPEIAQPNYTWFNLTGPIAGQNSSTYNVPLNEISLVNATWYYNGCKFITTSIETNSYPVVSVSEIPNVFSPNSDGLNPVFYAFTFVPSTDQTKLEVLFEEFSMQVFNRWGQLVFETSEVNKGWNGKDQGNTDVAEGVYFVLIKFNAICSDSPGLTVYNGTIQLLR